MASLEFLPTESIKALIEHQSNTAFDMHIDEANHLIRTQARGRWTLEEADDYVADLIELIDDCRRRFGCARVLADHRGGSVQPEAVVGRLAGANAAMFVDGDKLALVVDTSLAKGQMRRRFTHAGSQAFLSYTAAELWLTAWP